MDEHEIIRKILAGQKDAYAEIIRCYQQKVLGLCVSMLRNATQAEDAAQEIFIKAYQSLPSFRGDSSFSTWLYRIASNHCKDLLRKRSREKTQSFEELTEQMGDVSPAGDAVERLLEAPVPPQISGENLEAVEYILGKLSPEERLILTLREAEGLSYQEIAGMLGCSLEAVRSRLRRAREALDEKLRHFPKGCSV